MGKPLFLQIKEARPSVIAQLLQVAAVKHEGERVVQGQRMLQAASDIFLGWANGPLGRHFYFRQLRDMKLSANIELFDTDLLEGYARLCGWIMARAHAKASGQAIEVSAYIGRGDQFAEALRGLCGELRGPGGTRLRRVPEGMPQRRARGALGRRHGGGFPRVAAVVERRRVWKLAARRASVTGHAEIASQLSRRRVASRSVTKRKCWWRAASITRGSTARISGLPSMVSAALPSCSSRMSRGARPSSSRRVTTCGIALARVVAAPRPCREPQIELAQHRLEKDDCAGPPARGRTSAARRSVLRACVARRRSRG